MRTCPVCESPSDRGQLCSPSCRAESRRRTRINPNWRQMAVPAPGPVPVFDPWQAGQTWYPPAEVGTPLKPFVDELEEKKS